MKGKVVNFGSKQAEEEGDSEIEQFINQATETRQIKNDQHQ